MDLRINLISTKLPNQKPASQLRIRTSANSLTMIFKTFYIYSFSNRESLVIT